MERPEFSEAVILWRGGLGRQLSRKRKIAAIGTSRDIVAIAGKLAERQLMPEAYIARVLERRRQMARLGPRAD